MHFSDKITLRAVTRTINANGYAVETYTDTVVWADAKSVTRAEFYSADKAGIRADIMFTVHAEDWGNQTRAVYSTKEYNVIRSYAKGLGVVELTCSEVV